MAKPIIKEHNVETGEIIQRELNAEELARHNAYLAEQEIKQAEQAAKDAAKAELLAKLGITAEEAALLLA